MKIEITHYGHKASYEFDNDDVTLEELIYHIEQLIRLTGYSINGTLEIVKDEQ
jgi:transcriptional antiterminator